MEESESVRDTMPSDLTEDQQRKAHEKLDFLSRVFYDGARISTDDNGYIAVFDKDGGSFVRLEIRFSDLALKPEFNLTLEDSRIIEAFVLFGKLDDIEKDQILYRDQQIATGLLSKQRESCLSRLQQLGFAPV